MSVPARLAALAGQWTGTNRLILRPDLPAQESLSTMNIAPAAQGKFIVLHYIWAYEGQPQDGLLVVGQDEQVVQASWIDSFHMGDKFMACEGSADAQGGVLVKGSYQMPGYPVWGWQIEILPADDGTFQFVMHNITPEGDKYLAVDTKYRRQ